MGRKQGVVKCCIYVARIHTKRLIRHNMSITYFIPSQCDEQQNLAVLEREAENRKHLSQTAREPFDPTLMAVPSCSLLLARLDWNVQWIPRDLLPVWKEISPRRTKANYRQECKSLSHRSTRWLSSFQPYPVTRPAHFFSFGAGLVRNQNFLLNEAIMRRGEICFMTNDILHFSLLHHHERTISNKQWGLGSGCCCCYY